MTPATYSTNIAGIFFSGSSPQGCHDNVRPISEMDVGHSNNRTDMFYQFYPQKMSSFMWKLNEIDDQLLDHQLYLIFRQSHIR